MITREADYSIRAMYHLAHPDNLNRNVTVAQLAEAMEIPFRHLRRITLQLVHAGLLASEKGRNGGLRLAKAPGDISLLDILRIMDERNVHLNLCLVDPAACGRQPKCRIHKRIKKLQQTIDTELASITLVGLHKDCPCADQI